jgi:lipopolysaccharide transport system ATP-binding protein
VNEPAIVFDHVWKRFNAGEAHTSLRDLIPAAARRLVKRPAKVDPNAFWALQDVTFEVRQGEALGIIGPNGAGKSTTLKLLTRILRPTKGRCAVKGRVGALIELAAGFHPDLTGRENIYLQGAIMGMNRAEINRRFDDIVDFSEIRPFIDTPVKRYSSGMNARLGFAIAANLDPEVLLIDEVLAVGDFNFQQKCYRRLEEFRRSGIAIAFVSHNMQAIASLCSRAILLMPGRSGFVGDVSDVLALYASSGGAVADPRVTVSDARLSYAAGGREVSGPITPGAHVVLDIALTAQVPLPRCGVLFDVVRSDGLSMFRGMSTLDGIDEVHLEKLDTVKARIGFHANMLRGTYSVNVSLVDTMRQWEQVVVHGVRSFVVTETNRISGCAELAPTYELEVRPSDDRSAPIERRPTMSGR